MTRLDAIKRRYPSASTMRRLARQIPDVTALDLEWLLAQVEALAGAAKALHDAHIARISHGHTHPTGSYDFLPEHCVRCQAERQTTVALTSVQTALAALEAPDA